MRWEFVRDGVTIRAVRAVDTATDPDYQGRGLFRALTMHAVEAMTVDGVDFIFNTPNQRSKPGYLKMGWQEVGELPVAIGVRRLSAPAKLVRSRVPADLWSQPSAAGIDITDWLERNRGDPAPSESSAHFLETRLSAKFLEWRLGMPDLHYRVFEHDGGAVVVRMRRRGRSMELVQVLSLGLTDREADRAAGRAARAVGADYFLRLGVPALRSCVIRLPGAGPALTWRAVRDSEMPPLDSWRLTMSDIELF